MQKERIIQLRMPYRAYLTLSVLPLRIMLDFVGPLPEDKDFNCILTITDHLNSEFCLIPTQT